MPKRERHNSDFWEPHPTHGMVRIPTAIHVRGLRRVMSSPAIFFGLMDGLHFPSCFVSTVEPKMRRNTMGKFALHREKTTESVTFHCKRCMSHSVADRTGEAARPACVGIFAELTVDPSVRVSDSASSASFASFGWRFRIPVMQCHWGDSF